MFTYNVEPYQIFPTLFKRYFNTVKNFFISYRLDNKLHVAQCVAHCPLFRAHDDFVKVRKDNYGAQRFEFS